MTAADFALTRAEWQPVLFGTPNRADLAGCTPPSRFQTLRLCVHGNHGFEAVRSSTSPYAAWNGVEYEWMIRGYDDSLTFAPGDIPDVDIIWLDTDRIRHVAIDGIGAWLADRIRALRSQSDAPILVLAWPLGATDRERLSRAGIPGVRVADLASLAGTLGDNWLQARTESISGTRFSNQACMHVARELACCWLPALALPPRKAIVVDLDDTLYAGVLGEDGPSGVELTGSHRALQERLVAFRNAGILLALVSRNDARDVEALFGERRDFPLRLSDFSAVEASWDDKCSAIERITTALRIDCDSVVFVDDNAGELQAVAERLPVCTVLARPNGAETEAALRHVAGLFRWDAAPEDRLRAKDIRALRRRSDLQEGAASPDDYLRSLDVHLDFFVGPREYLPRLAELSAKTNQFNLSLARMNEAELARRLDACPSDVVAIRLADRIADSGIIGVLACSWQGNTLRVDELCVSCRALGRRLEDSMITTALLLVAGQRQPGNVMFLPRRGLRNEPARHWLALYAGMPLTDVVDCVEVAFEHIRGKVVSPALHLHVVQ
jgi:FkbH-like protein